MKPVWVTIGIIEHSKQIVIMGVSKSRAEAQQHGDERKDEYLIDSWQVFLFDGDTGDRLYGWFKKKGLTRTQAVHAIREVGKFFDGVLHGTTDENSAPTTG